MRLAIAWDYLYNFPDYEAAVKITEPLLSVVPTMNPTTRSLFYRLRIDSLITTGRKEQTLNMLVSGCDQGILSYADLGHTSFEQLKDHFGKNGPAAMAKKADAAHLKCIAEVRKDYFDKLAKKELPDPRLIARVAHDDVYSRGDCGEALTITAPLLKMDSETIDPSLRAQIIATQTAARKEANSTVCRGSGKICSQSQQTRGNSSTILIREKALMRATEMVLLYDYDTARQEYARWLAPNAGRLSTGEIARALFGKERDPSLDDLTQLAILEEALYLASTLTENCSQNLQAGEVMTIVSDLFLRYAAEKKWDDCLRISRRGRYALQWTSDASVAAGLDTRLGIAQYQQFQHPRFLQQMNLNLCTLLIAVTKCSQGL